MMQNLPRSRQCAPTRSHKHARKRGRGRKEGRGWHARCLRRLHACRAVEHLAAHAVVEGRAAPEVGSGGEGCGASNQPAHLMSSRLISGPLLVSLNTGRCCGESAPALATIRALGEQGRANKAPGVAVPKPAVQDRLPVEL
jgi:hypothetical protein